MAKRQMDARSPRGLLLGLLGLAGAGALMILLLFLKPGLPSSPTSTAEATAPTAGKPIYAGRFLHGRRLCSLFRRACKDWY